MRHRPLFIALLCLLASACLRAQTAGSPVSVLRATELRADKLSSAPSLLSLTAETPLRLLSLEGGWAWVEVGTQKGWVRASNLNLPTQASDASKLHSGRQISTGASLNTALTLGIRAIPRPAHRHAIIISAGQYPALGAPSLPGMSADIESASQMAQAMLIPQGNITYLQNQQATAPNIRKAIDALGARIPADALVFIYYSGYGARIPDAAGRCQDALLGYSSTPDQTSTLLPLYEMGDLLQPITQKTNQILLLLDTSHASSPTAAQSSAQGLRNANDEGELRAKSFKLPTFAACAMPINAWTPAQNLVLLTAAAAHETSLDDSEKGGLATQYIRDCMLRPPHRPDSAPPINIEAIRHCAQNKIATRMHHDMHLKAQTLQLRGNPEFMPLRTSPP